MLQAACAVGPSAAPQLRLLAAPAEPQRAARQLWQVTNTGAICIAKIFETFFSKKSLNWKIPVLKD